MRVLMFGWEFPPHISGGLGTACLGLSQSLVRENIDLLFVVPKVFGSEPSDEITLINASEVVIPFADNPSPVAAQKRKVTKTISTQHTTPRKVRKTRTEKSITLIEVESSLDPYNPKGLTSYNKTILDWNYSVEPSTQFSKLTTIETEEIDIPLKRGYKYPFSGTYGSNLFEEVNHYALTGAELAKEYDHSVIHAHDWMTFPAGMAAKKVSGKPLVVHVHATEFDRSGYCSGPVYNVEKRGLDAADRVVAVSEWTKNILVTRYGVPADKVTVVHNGVVESDTHRTAEYERISKRVVTFLGRVTHQKGPAYFVEAARKVSARFDDVHFIVAGSGDLLPQTIERVAQLRLSNRFHFTGFLTKQWIDRLWSISSVYVMPSVSEPFGITPLEALQAGVPVILSNQSGVAEVMPHALKADFWDTDALADAICSVLKYKSLASMLTKKGGSEIRNLSWTKAAVKLKNLYEEIAS